MFFLDCEKHGAGSHALLTCVHVAPGAVEPRLIFIDKDETVWCHECLHEQDPAKMGFICEACFREKKVN